MVATRNKYYGNPTPLTSKANDQPSISTQSTLDHPLAVIPNELTIKTPKGFIHKSTFNPRIRAAQNYNIIEDLAQAPSSMSTLKVLQNCSTQKRYLHAMIRGIYHSY